MLNPEGERIARLAAIGATNNDIAAQMFLSPSTVTYHLKSVYSKLKVRNRAQLARALEVL